MVNKKLVLLLLITFPLAVGLACLSSAPDPTVTPVPTETTAPEEPTVEPTIEVLEEATMTPIADGVQELVLLDNSLWVQEDNAVFASFILENPNPDVIFEDIEYTVTLYDSAGNEIDSDYAFIRSIYPDQHFGIVIDLYLSDENVTVDSILVDWAYENTVTTNGFTNPFTADSTIFWENDGFPMVTGKINNNTPDTLTNIRVNILCYGSSGEIVGGGYTFIDFIPANDYMGFSTYVDVFDDVATVEVFPADTYLSVIYEGSEFWSEISIQADAFTEGDFGDIVGGVVVKNETSTVLKDSILYITTYDESGNVTATSGSNIDVLLPGDTLGISPFITPPQGSVNPGYDIWVLPGEHDPEYELETNPFVVNNTAVTGDFESYVAVNFTNNYSKLVSEVEIFVLVFNADGKIIGGGRDWTDEPTPAGATTEIEVWINTLSSETIDSIEAWVTPNYWTSFE